MMRFAIVLLFFSIQVRASSHPGQVQGVEDFHQVLITVMQAGDAFDARHQVMLAAVDGLFDVVTIARISVGRTWSKLDDAQRSHLVAALRDLIAATYADRFVTYNDQRFETLQALQGKSGVVVKTRLLRRSGEPVTLDYYFRGDHVFNVVADGVSDLSLRRADYNSVIKTSGFDSLLEQLIDNVQTYRSVDE